MKKTLLSIFASGLLLCAPMVGSAEAPATSKNQETWSRMSQIQSMLEYFYLEAGFYPATLEELDQLVNSKAPRNARTLPIPKDPITNQPFQYVVDKTSKKYRLSVPDATKYDNAGPLLTNMDWGFLSDLADLRRYEQIVRHSTNMMKAVATSCELFAKDHKGAFPESLDDLLPKYMGRFPTDPITGKNLNYKKADNGYVISCPNPDRYGFKIFQYSSATGMQVEQVNKPKPDAPDSNGRTLPKLKFEPATPPSDAPKDPATPGPKAPDAKAPEPAPAPAEPPK